MMDFDNILDIATQNQGVSSVQKRYSLQAGPPKKDPKSKGVNPAAVEALLKKQQFDRKKKELEMKKQKDVLFAKRVELKSDRKARAMASRTKDNFKGYNGVPIVEATKKRRSDLNMHDDQSVTSHGFRNTTIDPENDEDNYEYDDSESEQEPEPLRPGKSTGDGYSSNKSFSKKPKPAPPPLNFADLLKLAEKKQHEPVDLKPKVVRKEERLRTADEIKEEEMERRAKRLDKHRDSKTERERDTKPQSGSNLTRTNTLEKEQKICKPQKNLLEKQTLSSGSGKKSQSDRGHSSLKSSLGDRERERPKISQNDRDRSKSSSSSSAINSKGISKSTSSQVLIKQGPPKSSSSHKSSTLSDLSFKKESLSSFQGRSSGIAGTRPPGATVTGQKSHHGTSQQTIPSNGGSFKEGAIVGGSKSRKGEPLKTGIHAAVKSNSNAVRNSTGGPSKAGSQPQPRPGGKLPAQAGGAAVQARPGGSGPQRHPGGNGSRPPGSFSSRPGSGGPVPGRSSGPMGSGPGRPKCTVVSETISSKNVGGHKQGGPPRPGMPQRPGMPPRPGMLQRPGMPPRPGMPQRPGMPPRPGMPQRPGMPPRPLMNRPPGAMLPPITSAYKRKYEEEEEYDSEMDDFIDDAGDEQEEISRHIKEIFGYDRNKYKDESDYALKFMESSWKDVQKEEARSLKMAVQEDLEEERREEEEIKRKTGKRKKI